MVYQPTDIRKEVADAQEHLRVRLQGAVSQSSSDVDLAELPSVPLIDLGSSLDGSLDSKKAVAAQIREACITTGFFQIKNHGITSAATDGILEQAKRIFHELTPEQKHAIHIRHSQLFRGYEPADFSIVDADDVKRSGDELVVVETKEGFNWGYEDGLLPDGSDGKYVELDGIAPGPGRSNVWPSEDDLPGFFNKIADYYTQAIALCRHLFGLFAISLGLDESYFNDVLTHPGGIGRLLYYPPNASSEVGKAGKDGRLGLGAHTDYECFTLLLCSSNPGLEILFPPTPQTNNKPIWRPCPVRPGTITVNVADFLMRWTNGLYKSTIHRVMQKTGGEARYSVPLFFSINYDSDVLPLPEKAVGKSRFPPMRAGQYVLERLKATTAEGRESTETPDIISVES